MITLPPLLTYYLNLILPVEIGSWQWLAGLAGPVLMTTAIGGVIGLFSLIIVTRRFLATDFPAAMKGVSDRLDDHARKFERLDLDVRKLVIDHTTLSVRHDSLRGRVDRLEEREERLDLDDTRTRRRQRRETDDERSDRGE